jgi:AcrR family transcriptional regulator
VSEGQQRLPPGQHGLSPELVARNQRERLIAAIAEACAEESYAEVSVADIVARAGVSTATFYKRFDSKRDCLLAAHAELFGRLLEEVGAACAAAPAGEKRIRAGIGTCLELLAADPPSARLLTVEVQAAGPAGSELYARSVAELAGRLLGEQATAAEDLVTDAEWAAVASLVALVARRVMAGEAVSLPELEDELTRIALAAR